MLNPSLVQIPFEIWGSIFCIMCGVIVLISRKGEKTKKSGYLFSALFTEAIQLISDAAALYFRGNPTTLGFYTVRISNYIVFITNFAQGLLLVLYISSVIEGISLEKLSKWIKSAIAISCIGSILMTLSQFSDHIYYYFDETNSYHRTDLFWLNSLISLSAIILGAAMLIRFRKNIKPIDFAVLLTYTSLPVIVVIVQIFVYGLSLTNIANAITLLLIFVVHEYDKSTKLVEQEKKVANQKAQLSDTKVSLMMAKIHPHFISNTLLTIQGLYHENIDEGDKIMNTFIRYLQQSFSNISVNEPIDFEVDLNHAMQYSEIALARWPDMDIEYNITCTDFEIPYLTLQPLIENAVRHGLMPLEEGGKITVSTYEDNEYNYVSIVDNGVGFDINNPISHQFKNDRAHIGLSNVKDRIRIMSNGTLEIDSKIDEGTSILIKLPKEET